MRPLPFPVDAAAELIREPTTFGMVLYLICLTAYGDELHGDPDQGLDPMDPLDLYVRLEDDFHAEITEEGQNRLNAIIMAVSTDAFYEDPMAFTAIAMALYSGDLGDMVSGVMEELSVPEMLWAEYEVGLCREEEEPFDPEVQALQDSIILEEAEDNEELEADEVIPYYEAETRELRQELLNQLAKLGIQPEYFPEI